MPFCIQVNIYIKYLTIFLIALLTFLFYLLDESLVISAPTGSGKTVVFELGIIKLLLECGSSFPDFKIVYSK